MTPPFGFCLRRQKDEQYCECYEPPLLTCPFCHLPSIECACEEPEPEPVRCVECGMPVFLCECDVKILEEEGEA